MALNMYIGMNALQGGLDVFIFIYLLSSVSPSSLFVLHQTMLEMHREHFKQGMSIIGRAFTINKGAFI